MRFDKLKIRFLIIAVSGVLLTSSGCLAEKGIDAQLEINKTALLSKNSTDKNRVNAAVLLLLSRDGQAREILLDSLYDVNNPVPRIALCRALKQSRTWDKTVKDKLEFLKPLIAMLGSENENEAIAAGEALLVFDYSKIASQIKTIASSPKAKANWRSKAVYAMRIRPEKQAMLDLIDLAENGDSEISSQAEQALEKLLGVPPGADKDEWKRISSELKKKSRRKFIADRLVRQHDKLRQVEDELKQWQEMYFSSLDDFYDKLTEDTAKGEFIIKGLDSDKDDVKIWALQRAGKWIKTGKPLPEDISNRVISLVSDNNNRIRLLSARMLATLGNTNPADALLEQIKVEKSQDIAFEQFKALGEAVYYALSPGSNIKIDKGIRLEALKLAETYMDSNEPEVFTAAGRVIRKLLSQNGLEKDIVTKYLRIIRNKYVHLNDGWEKDSASGSGQLLAVMSRLSQEDYPFKQEAAEEFRQLFQEGLNSTDASIRQAVIVGLANIDAGKAVKKFRDEKLYNDSSDAVVAEVITAAEKAGTGEDLQWLMDKFDGNNSSGAWRAFLAILAKQDTATVVKWIDMLKQAGVKSDNYDQLLLMAEKKAAEEKIEMPLSLLSNLADVYQARGDIDKALNYLNQYIADANEKPDSIYSGKAVELYLKKKDYQATGKIVSELLADKEITDEMPVVKAVNGFIADKDIAASEKTTLLAVLSSIQALQNSPQTKGWSELLEQWRQMAGLNKVEQLNKK